MNSERLYQAKEFAAKAGTTVRTLHFYDRKGLLKACVPLARSNRSIYAGRPRHQARFERLWSDPTHWPKDFKRPWSDAADGFIHSVMNCEDPKAG